MSNSLGSIRGVVKNGQKCVEINSERLKKRNKDNILTTATKHFHRSISLSHPDNYQQCSKDSINDNHNFLTSLHFVFVEIIQNHVGIF